MHTANQILKSYFGYDSFRPLQEEIISHVLQRKDAQCAFPPILTEIKKPSFDAATSSFGDSKEGEFYNVISNVKKQCIIVTKDFITKGEVRRNDIQGLVLCIASRKPKASTQIIWQPFVQS